MTGMMARIWQHEIEHLHGSLPWEEHSPYKRIDRTIAISEVMQDPDSFSD